MKLFKLFTISEAEEDAKLPKSIRKTLVQRIKDLKKSKS